MADVELLDRLEKVSSFTADEILTAALGLPKTGRWHDFFKPVVWSPAELFGKLSVNFDRWVARWNFRDSATHLLPRFIRGYRVHGLDNVPRDGPLLVLSNHPGTYDSLVISSAIPRTDMKVMASAIPLLQHLPTLSENLVYVGRDIQTRAFSLRASIRHLEAGGALLLYPHGGIERDPALFTQAEAAERVHNWSESFSVIMRRVPEAQIMIAIVSGVIYEKIVRSPLTWLRRQLQDRVRLGEFVQVIKQLLKERSLPLVPQVSFTKPFTGASIDAREHSDEAVQVVLNHALEQLAFHVAHFGLAIPE